MKTKVILTPDHTRRRTPDELKSKTSKQPLSTRVKTTTYEALEKISAKHKTSISDLSAGILEDYVQWYEEQYEENGIKNGKNKK